MKPSFRYADHISLDDEVLVFGDDLIPTKVVNVSSIMMEGNTSYYNHPLVQIQIISNKDKLGSYYLNCKISLIFVVKSARTRMAQMVITHTMLHTQS